MFVSSHGEAVMTQIPDAVADDWLAELWELLLSIAVTFTLSRGSRNLWSELLIVSWLLCAFNPDGIFNDGQRLCPCTKWGCCSPSCPPGYSIRDVISNNIDNQGTVETCFCSNLHIVWGDWRALSYLYVRTRSLMSWFSLSLQPVFALLILHFIFRLLNLFDFSVEESI